MQKKSETLRQREKAQKDLLELKKAQQGLAELETSEEKPIYAPTTFKEKKENFFYHHKVAFYVTTCLLLVLALVVIDTLTKTKYDDTVVLFTHEMYSSAETEALAEILAEYSNDVDKNGVVNISVFDCSYNADSTGYEYQIQQRSKVQARITAGNAMLFLLDEAALNDLKTNLKFELFPEENRVNIKGILKGTKAENETRKDLFLCLREIKGSTAENKLDEYNNAKALIEKVKEANKQSNN